MTTLTFIYNAKSNNLSKAFDFAHKIISSKTYNCELCTLTHGNFKEKKEWEDFKNNTSIKMEFYYKDEFEKKYNTSFKYPVILKTVNSKFGVLLNKTELEELNSTHKLIKAIEKKNKYA